MNKLRSKEYKVASFQYAIETLRITNGNVRIIKKVEKIYRNKCTSVVGRYQIRMKNCIMYEMKYDAW